ncbi:MAG TPA: hypothetical protein VGO47_08200 [Chlamydiales bacterium]|nr:hypothetical protein [Chlamydiales bacterium]
MQWLTTQLYVFCTPFLFPFLLTQQSLFFSKSAQLGDKVLGASGVETFIALWSPWFGQVNSALLVGPSVPALMDSQLAAVLATCMSLTHHSSFSLG